MCTAVRRKRARLASLGVLSPRDVLPLIALARGNSVVTGAHIPDVEEAVRPDTDRRARPRLHQEGASPKMTPCDSNSRETVAEFPRASVEGGLPRRRVSMHGRNKRQRRAPVIEQPSAVMPWPGAALVRGRKDVRLTGRSTARSCLPLRGFASWFDHSLSASAVSPAIVVARGRIEQADQALAPAAATDGAANEVVGGARSHVRDARMLRVGPDPVDAAPTDCGPETTLTSLRASTPSARTGPLPGCSRTIWVESSQLSSRPATPPAKSIRPGRRRPTRTGAQPGRLRKTPPDSLVRRGDRRGPRRARRTRRPRRSAGETRCLQVYTRHRTRGCSGRGRSFGVPRDHTCRRRAQTSWPAKAATSVAVASGDCECQRL